MKEMEVESLDSYELILVANYDKDSSDRTPAIVQEISTDNPGIKVITREKKGKMGWDMRSGLEAATGQYIAVIDGDGQMPVSDIPLVYHIIKTGRYDLVKTYRAIRHDGWFRSLMSFGYNWLFRLMFFNEFPIIDVNSKPKIMTREAFSKIHLKSNDWFTDSEIVIETFRNRMRICEVSTTFYKNERRKSLVNIMTAFEFLINLIAYRIRH
jgi:glycosyltransferase involved in cell wall biosynthesis